MSIHLDCSDDEFLDLKTLLLPTRKPTCAETKPLRRSPRKPTTTTRNDIHHQLSSRTEFSATSSQRQHSPTKGLASKRSPLKALQPTSALLNTLEHAPVLPRKDIQSRNTASANNRQSKANVDRPVKAAEDDLLLESFSRLGLNNDNDTGSSLSNSTRWNKRQPVQAASVVAEATHDRKSSKSTTRRSKEAQRASRFVLDEARCEEDLNDSDAQEEGEDEDTDLSGFIVDDDAEISYHGSTDGVDSEEERRSRRKAREERPRRRLQRGRRKSVDSGDEASGENGLTNALSNMNLDGVGGEHSGNRQIEVIDLISPEHKHQEHTADPALSRSVGTNLFDKFKALKLSPPKSSQMFVIPSKSQPANAGLANVVDEHEYQQEDRFTTPPATPPQSPTKLRSPTKLLSPSKQGDAAPRSPHRQSMDAFWDLNEVNEWHDQFSPKKAPLGSPRKNRLAEFGLWSDEEEGEDDSCDAINQSSDSLPSPCESPSKSKSRSVSPTKVEKQRFIAEKKAKQLEKQSFDKSKDQMATDLLLALDKHVTGSKISKLSASTGGVQIVWSNTLRSTAGRANWRRTVNKPTDSPIKTQSEESAQGITIQHFANIELATKIIDRPERLISTLAHEFCHLANFMVSGVRDQPHGASFQSWAQKVTNWMKSQTDVAEWQTVKVTTKHGYAIDWKYLWVCVGRDQTKAMEILNISDEDGCGSEYGRHSKSIDPVVARCGRCKGRLVQVRPKPRASPVKKTELKRPVRTKMGKSGFTAEMVEIIELSD